MQGSEGYQRKRVEKVDGKKVLTLFVVGNSEGRWATSRGEAARCTDRGKRIIHAGSA